MQVIAGASKSDPGYVHIAVVKLRMVQWFLNKLCMSISSASDSESVTVTSEGYQQLRSACASPLTFYNKFARSRRADHEQDICTLRVLCEEAMSIFSNGLRGSAEAAAFEFLAAVFCCEGDGEAGAFADKTKTFPLKTISRTSSARMIQPAAQMKTSQCSQLS